MGVLQRFERRLGGLVEGAFAKVFKGDVQPVEVAGALQRETDDRKTVVGQGKVLVPNDFVVELGQHDFERLSPWAQQLGDELAAMVKEHAGEQGYSFVGPVKVALEQMDGIDTGTFRVRSGVLAGDVLDGGVRNIASTAPRLTSMISGGLRRFSVSLRARSAPILSLRTASGRERNSFLHAGARTSARNL